MGTSFKDQLLQKGLVNKKQVNKAQHEKRVDRKKNKGGNDLPEINKTLQERLATEKRNQELNQQLNQEKHRRENLAQVRQLIETNRLTLDDYDEPYYFAMGKKIKKLYVSEEIAKKLTNGQLAIVTLDDRFEIVPVKAAHQIADRDKGALVVLNEPDTE